MDFGELFPPGLRMPCRPFGVISEASNRGRAVYAVRPRSIVRSIAPRCGAFH